MLKKKKMFSDMTHITWTPLNCPLSYHFAEENDEFTSLKRGLNVYLGQINSKCVKANRSETFR